MIIETISPPFAISNPGADVTTSSITEPSPTATTPTGDGVLSIGGGETGQGGKVSNGLLIVPYGVGSATNTFSMKIYGWRSVRQRQGATTPIIPLWVPYLLASFTCTLCTLAGVAGTPVDNTHLFCGTITLGVGNANISNEIISPTGNVMASIILDRKGSQLVEVRFGTGGSATSANCLYAEV